MGDHADEAIYDLLFGRGWDNDDDHYADTLSYRNPRGGDDYFEAERLQPKFQQLRVSQVHGHTPKSICVSGVVIFDTPYRGMKQFEFLADWIPLSQCILTGNTARIPQWLIRSRWQQRTKRQAQFTDLADEAGRITRRRTY